MMVQWIRAFAGMTISKDFRSFRHSKIVFVIPAKAGIHCSIFINRPLALQRRPSKHENPGGGG
jgi:hypothetical protein